MTTIRKATAQDASAIAAIYNDAVKNTTAIWNENTVDTQNRIDWMRERQSAGLPVFVAVTEQDNAVGYASYGPWRAWDGYRHTVEHSVYVDQTAQGKGIGRQLMMSLIDHARRQKLHVMVAGIEAENNTSIRLHELLGFEHAGRLSQVGTKFGRWLDLTFMQLRLEQPEGEV